MDNTKLLPITTFLKGTPIQGAIKGIILYSDYILLSSDFYFFLYYKLTLGIVLTAETLSYYSGFIFVQILLQLKINKCINLPTSVICLVMSVCCLLLCALLIPCDNTGVIYILSNCLKMG